MTYPKAHWRIICERYPCTTCGAGPGEPCLTPTRHHADLPHVTRTRLAAANDWHDPEDTDVEPHGLDSRV